MVCMYMAFDNPFQRQLVAANVLDQPVSLGVGNASGGIVKVEYRVEDGAGTAGRVCNDVADCVGRFVKEGLDVGSGVHVNRIVAHSCPRNRVAINSLLSISG